MKKTTTFQKIFNAYADRVGKSGNSLRFMFDGARLLPEKTPLDYEMEDNDTIDALTEQTGGFF